jgi:transposase
MPLGLKMATPQQRGQCVLQLAKKESVTAVQRAFRTQFHIERPSRVSIYAWYKKFEQKGCICKGKSPGRPSVSDAAVDRVRACFQRSPQKSTRRASSELQLPQTTVSKILRTRLFMKPYKLQLVQALKPEDLAVRYEFCREILARIESDDLPARFIF